MQAKAAYYVAKQEVEDINNPRESAPPVDTGFKVKGEVNIGTFDLFQMQKDAMAKSEEIKKEFQVKIDSLSQDSAHYREEANNLRFQMMEAQFKTQIDLLMKQMSFGQNNQPNFSQQINQVMEMASALGYQKPVPGMQDPSLQLQMLKMQNDNAREEREFKWKMEQDKWERDARFEEIRQNAVLEQKKLDQQAKKNDMIAALPETVGTAIARGLVSGAKPAAAAKSVQSQAQPANVGEAQKRAAGKVIEAGEGEFGQSHCPGCDAVIEIAAETTEAVCANCGARIPVRRVAGVAENEQ